MNKLIIYPLVILGFCAVLTQLMNYGNYTFTSTGYLAMQGQNSSATQPDWFNPSTWGYFFTSSATNSYSVNPVPLGLNLGEFVALLIAFVAIACIAGITLFGSGISTSAQNVLYKSVFFYTIWGVFSATAINGISSIPTFGVLIYIAMTLGYVIGVQGQINTHEG